jgi:phenylpropionate dioxygenase-like ring-hydroxylating dioxygenase large terminal subunit
MPGGARMTQKTVRENFSNGLSVDSPASAELHKERYTSPGFMQREWDQLWTQCWLFAGLLSDIPEPGDYFVFELGRESIVVLRDEDDAVRAFYNVCQHRGNRLLASESGFVNNITCPYHGWRYGLDGQLLEVPDSERFCPPVPVNKRSLKQVQVEHWAGMVWINMDPAAAPLMTFLGDIVELLQPYHFEHMKLARHQTVLLDANWKTARDNFLEQYHVDFIHPQHASLVDCCNSSNTLWPLGHSATAVEGFTTDSRYPLPQQTPAHLVPLLQGLGLDPDSFNDNVDSIRAAVQKQKRNIGPGLGFDYSNLSDAQLTDVWQYDIFPNLFFTIQAEELWIYGPRPHPSDPNQCYFDKWTLQIPLESAADPDRKLTLNPSLETSADAQRPEHERFTQDEVVAGKHSLTITIDQDIYYLRDMQAGMHSRGFDRAILNQDEARVQHFHDWLEAWLQGYRP